jgi:hypothetical protein
MFEWLGFANASERFALDFADELVNALDHLSVLLLPVEVVFPCLV